MKNLLFKSNDMEIVLKKVEGLSVGEIDGKTVITAPEGAVYLSEFMNTLPVGILNKKETGCGATTVVLENEEDVVVACPNKQLIINKVNQYPNQRCPYELLAVKQGVTADDIEEYIIKCKGKQPIKIMVTYDSLPRVCAVMRTHVSDYKVVVDEYQEILSSCVYRNKAVNNLLQELKDQKNVTYLSATPIPYNYTPEVLKKLPKYEIIWKNTIRIMPHRLQTNSPHSAVVNIIRQHKSGYPFTLGGYKVKEYFFFVNSVSAIGRIIKSAKLDLDEVKIICSNNDVNRYKLKGLPLGDATGTNKTFTFCTKSAFYGVDFQSDAGLVIIVSDGYTKSSLLDISTDITQIAGRIRTKENPFKHVILHIYSKDMMCQSKEEFDEWYNARLKYANDTIKACNDLIPELRGCITERIKLDDPEEFVYYNEVENRIELDSLKMAHAKYTFESVDSVYVNGLSLRDAYLKAGYNVEGSKYWEQQIKNMVFAGMGDRFETYYKMYSDEIRKSTIGKSDLAKDIEFHYGLIPKAYNFLGDEQVAKLKYDEYKVRDMVHYRLPQTKDALNRELKVTFQEGNQYSLKEIKFQLGLIFQKLRIGITANAVLLKEYCNLKRVKLNNGNGRVDGYRINNYLFMCFSTKRSVEYYL